MKEELFVSVKEEFLLKNKKRESVASTNTESVPEASASSDISNMSNDNSYENDNVAVEIKNESVDLDSEVVSTIDLLPDSLIDTKTEEDRDQDTDRNSNKRKNKEQQNSNRNTKLKNRHNTSHPDKADRLCNAVLRGDTCPYSDKCQYSHDIKKFLLSKPSDISDSCYLYNTFGYCNHGVMCRFANSHINHETGENLSRTNEEGGVIERVHINLLHKDLQLALRKKQSDQFISNKKKQKNVTNCSANITEVVSNSDIVTTENDNDNQGMNLSAYPSKEVKLIDFSNKVYIAPLTTVGNLPFRRVMKDFGADITCGEMAMASNVLQGQASEWALLRRHTSEDVFGIQLAGNHEDLLGRVCRVVESEVSCDFVDLNCGCPIDVVCNRGCGSALMNRHNKLCDMVTSMLKAMPSRGLTVKIRTGWEDKVTTTKLIPYLQKAGKGRLSALMVHGRSRLQRYSKPANWESVLQVAQAQDSSLPLIPVIGNGDIMSWADWNSHQHLISSNLDDPEKRGLTDCAMLARGALVKPWLPKEIKERRDYDISASERLDMLKNFCNYGLEHWGSDQQGVNNTRRFLLEWLSFLHRYVPSGLLEYGASQKMDQRPPNYYGRSDLETLMASSIGADWVKISEMLLGPVPEGFFFAPKHKSNAYAPDSELVANG